MDPKLGPHYTLAKFYHTCHSSKLIMQNNLTKQRRLSKEKVPDVLIVAYFPSTIHCVITVGPIECNI